MSLSVGSQPTTSLRHTVSTTRTSDKSVLARARARANRVVCDSKKRRVDSRGGGGGSAGDATSAASPADASDDERARIEAFITRGRRVVSRELCLFPKMNPRRQLAFRNDRRADPVVYEPMLLPKAGSAKK